MIRTAELPGLNKTPCLEGNGGVSCDATFGPRGSTGGVDYESSTRQGERGGESRQSRGCIRVLMEGCNGHNWSCRCLLPQASFESLERRVQHDERRIRVRDSILKFFERMRCAYRGQQSYETHLKGWGAYTTVRKRLLLPRLPIE